MARARCILCGQLVDARDCYWSATASATYDAASGQPDSIAPTCTDCLLDVLAFGESEAHPNEDAPLASDFEE